MPELSETLSTPVVTFREAFALIEGDKRPAVTWSDPRTCRPPNTFPGRHGLPTGPRNGFWVLDLDRKNGVDGLRSLMAYASDHGDTPQTFTVRTPSGGMHLYFAWEENRPVGNPVGILPGVDVRGAGGYVCAGGDYQIVENVPLVVAPEWLYALVTSRAQLPKGESAIAITQDHPEWDSRHQMAEDFLAGEPPCVSGEGGQRQIWKIALRLMRTFELPVDSALDCLQAYNARCRPLWGEDDLRRHLLRAAQEGHGPTGMFSTKAGGFFGGETFAPAALPLPSLPIEGPWRQIRNPQHVYTFDSSMPSNPGKKQLLDPGTLADQIVGPAACPDWLGVWQYDQFRRKLIAVNPPMRLDAETIGLSDRDIASIRLWVTRRGGSASKEIIHDIIHEAGKTAEFHPVREYLDGLPTSSTEDADRYFQGIAGRLWGAEGLQDARESGHLRRLAIAAVRRIRVPGTKVDVMLILAGEQGFRKSLMCAKLFGDWFLDQVPPISSGRGIEASIAIEGRWGVEIAEMSAFSGVAESAKKEFLTRCTDKYRPVFGIAVQERPRECVFIGTTNDDDFLTDPTGDTRYDICDIQQPINLEALDRDAFWSAACALESAGEPHFRDRAELARGVVGRGFFDPILHPREGEGFSQADPWAKGVLAWAEKSANEGQVEVTASDGLEIGLAIPVERRDPKSLNRVRNILRRAYGASSVKWTGGRAQRVYTVK